MGSLALSSGMNETTITFRPLPVGTCVRYNGSLREHTGDYGTVDDRDLGAYRVGVTWDTGERSGEHVDDLLVVPQEPTTPSEPALVAAIDFLSSIEVHLAGWQVIALAHLIEKGVDRG